MRTPDQDKFMLVTRGLMLLGMVGVGYGGYTVKEELSRTRDNAAMYQQMVMEKLESINSTLIASSTKTDNNTARIQTLEERILWMERSSGRF